MTAERTLYHMSEADLDAGDLLEARGLNPLDSDTEEFLERERPQGAIPRRQAVFMINEAGIARLPYMLPVQGTLYVVEPTGPVSVHDHAFAHAVYKEIARAETRDCKPDIPRISAWAKHYWAGSRWPSGRGTNLAGKLDFPSMPEYLASGARVLRVAPGILVRPPARRR
jgi:hypothetical protein